MDHFIKNAQYSAFICQDKRYTIDSLPVSFIDDSFFVITNSIKKEEYIATRHCLYQLFKRMNQEAFDFSIKKSLSGKPFLENFEGFISLSHSKGMSATILSKTPVGIDIQMHTEKLFRIQSKFTTEQEIENIGMPRPAAIHLIWGAKEAIFKAYGLGEVDFIKDIRLESSSETSTWQGFLKRKNQTIPYQIHFKTINTHYLCIAIQNL